MINLDYKSSVPIYEQLINEIIRLKALGAISGNESLPSVRTLAMKLSINPNTVQRAYKWLEEQGIIYIAKGKGTFLADDEESEQAAKNVIKNNFLSAAKKANSLGLTKEELIEIIKNL